MVLKLSRFMEIHNIQAVISKNKIYLCMYDKLSIKQTIFGNKV